MGIMGEQGLYLVEFMRHCPHDKDHLVDIVNRYTIKVAACGRRLAEHCSGWTYFKVPSSEPDEFIEFIDGNGFKVEERDANRYHIYPEYTQEKSE